MVGDYEITAEDQAAPKQRGYTTRAKEEARRTEVKFTGLVRRWERRWVRHGHLRVLRWERVEEQQERSRGPSRADGGGTAAEEPARKRARP